MEKPSELIWRLLMHYSSSRNTRVLRHGIHAQKGKLASFVSATYAAAKATETEDLTGTLKAGKKADIILFDRVT